MKRRKRIRIAGEILGLFFCLIMLIPFWTALVNSFKTREEAALVNMALPTVWNVVQNYVEMVEESNFFNALKNSIILTVSTVTAVVLSSSMFSFVVQRRTSKGAARLLTLVMLGMFLPVQMIPTYFVCYFVQVKSFMATFFVLTATSLPMSVFLYTGFLKSIPRELDESAKLDGCDCLSLFARIIFPLLKPMTVTVFIISFMNVWNDFSTTIYFLNTSKNYTLPLTIYNFYGVHSSEWNLIFANVVMVSMPVIIIYFLAQKQIVAGMTAGAVKG